MKMKKKHETFGMKTVIALIFIVFLLGVGAVTLYYSFYKVSYMKTYDILIKSVAGKTVGFNADPNLHFGKIPSSGGMAEKNIILNNSKDYPVMVKITLSGEARGYVTFSDNNFVIGPNELRVVNAYATIPGGYGHVRNITGEAKVVLLRQ